MGEPEKKSKGVKEQENRYQKLLAYVGDFGEEQIPSNIAKLTQELNAAEPQFNDFLAKTISSCISWLPYKQHIYSACLLSITNERPELVKQILEGVLRNFKESLDNGNLYVGKMCLRFLGGFCVGKGISQTYLNKVIGECLRCAEKEDKSSEFMTFLLAGVTEELGPLFDEVNFERLKRLLEKPVFEFWVQYCRAFSSLTETRYTRIINYLKDKEWPEHPIKKYLPETACEIQLEEFTVEPSEKCVLQSPVCISLLETTQPPVLQEVCHDIIFGFGEKTEIAAEKLVDLNMPQVVVNTVFEGLLQLPKPSQKVLVYCSLYLELQRKQQAANTFEPLLEETFEKVFERLDEMDPTALENFQRFLALYISNQSFCWRWEFFLSEMTESKLRFLKGLLKYLLRLAHRKILEDELPESLSAYLPEKDTPLLRFTEIEESVDNTDAQLIIDRINSKASTAMMKSLLSSKEICNSGEILNRIFCECIFYQGAKSIMHINTYLERYSDIITGLPASLILESLENVWKNNDHRLELVSEKLLNLKIVSGTQVAEWCLDRLKRKQWTGVEWKLLEMGCESDHRVSILEMISRGVVVSQEDQMVKKLVEFFRAQVPLLKRTEVELLVNILPEDLQNVPIDLHKLN